MRVSAERFDRGRTRIVCALHQTQLLGELAQGGLPTLRDDAVGGLQDRVEDPVDTPALPSDGAEGEVEVALLSVAVAFHRKELILRIHGFARAHDLREERPDHRPDLGPRLEGTLSEHAGMLGAGDRAPSVIVEERELGPPVQSDRKSRTQADAHR